MGLSPVHNSHPSVAQKKSWEMLALISINHHLVNCFLNHYYVTWNQVCSSPLFLQSSSCFRKVFFLSCLMPADSLLDTNSLDCLGGEGLFQRGSVVPQGQIFSLSQSVDILSICRTMQWPPKALQLLTESAFVLWLMLKK